MANKGTKNLGLSQREELLTTLEVRFEENMHRHPDVEWAQVRARLEADPGRLWSLSEMERTGGEPDVVGEDSGTGEYLFVCRSSGRWIRRRRAGSGRRRIFEISVARSSVTTASGPSSSITTVRSRTMGRGGSGAR